METTADIRSYLDSYEMITVAISHHYYEGKSNVFYLRYPDGTLKKLDVKGIEQYSKAETIYRLAAPKDLVIGAEYQIVEEHAKAMYLEYSMIVKTKQFDEEFAYSGDDLGAIYTKESTSFAVWAPTATSIQLQIQLPGSDENFCFPMKRTEKGVFRAVVEQDLERAQYVYLVKVNGTWNQTTDPYARASMPNHSASVVIDQSKVAVDFHNNKLPLLKDAQDAVIYEASVRDFSMKLKTDHAGKFTGMITSQLMTESMKPAGFDYVTQLGITHIQLLPVFDFYTVDEYSPLTLYNWGYDPIQWMVPEGSYASDVKNPYSRVIELKEVVSKMHEHGIRVIMDVVYNHLYMIHGSSFEALVPNYYFRRSNVGAYSNGSFCGNDFESTSAMGRKYIIDACLMWMNEYGFDGYRFDLMGIIDRETMNQIVAACLKIKPDALFYGEGWNMPTMLPDDQKSMMDNHARLPHISFFNDRFRDVVKGKSGADEINVKGYGSGNSSLIEQLKAVIQGNVLPSNLGLLFNHPSQSINYVECHDNATSWDKLKECCKEDDREMRMQRQKLMIGIIMVAQGIPFLHMGQEFCRTKNGVHNSYNSPDAINAIDWERKDRYQSVVDYTKDMIKLRKQFSCFRFKTTAEIKKHVSFSHFAENVLVYRLANLQHDVYNEIQVIINPTNVIAVYTPEDGFEMIANESGLLTKPMPVHRVLSNPASMVVLGKRVS